MVPPGTLYKKYTYVKQPKAAQHDLTQKHTPHIYHTSAQPHRLNNAKQIKGSNWKSLNQQPILLQFTLAPTVKYDLNHTQSVQRGTWACRWTTSVAAIANVNIINFAKTKMKKTPALWPQVEPTPSISGPKRPIKSKESKPSDAYNHNPENTP